MKPTLYEALGVVPGASEDEIRAALRRLVRKYFAGTQRGDGDIEEALRFINHAHHVLGDPERRARYDRELAGGPRAPAIPYAWRPSQQSGDDRPSTDVSDVATAMDAPPDVPEAPPELDPGAMFLLARLRRSGIAQLAFAGVVMVVLAIAVWVSLPGRSVVEQGRTVLIWLTVVLLIAALVHAVIHALAKHRQRGLFSPLEVALAEAAIPKWRRERTVFVGAADAPDDSTWLFRLRMAELERSRAQRTSDPRPWARFGARVLDYGLWGLMLGGLLVLLGLVGLVGPGVAAVLTHPLLAPVIVTASWVPIEAELLSRLQTTPGKWLFGIYLQSHPSAATAPGEILIERGPALRRALAVWLRGLAGALPFVTLFSMAVAKETLARDGETPWDAQGDWLVTHAPLGPINGVTSALALACLVWIFGAAWQAPLERSRESVSAWARDQFEVAGQSVALAQRAAQDRWQRVRGMFSDEAATPPASGSAGTGAAESPAVAVAPGRTAVPGADRTPAGADQGPTPLQIKERRWKEYEARATSLLASGRWGELERVCRPWAEEDYRNPDAHFCAGMALQGLGRHREAIAALNRAAALLPRDAPLQERIQAAVVKSFRARNAQPAGG